MPSFGTSWRWVVPVPAWIEGWAVDWRAVGRVSFRNICTAAALPARRCTPGSVARTTSGGSLFATPGGPDESWTDPMTADAAQDATPEANAVRGSAAARGAATSADGS